MPFQIQQPTEEKDKQITLSGYTEEDGVTEIIIPEEIKALGKECFFGCKNIISVNFIKSKIKMNPTDFYCRVIDYIIENEEYVPSVIAEEEDQLSF